ncbi:cytoplasmic protein [Kwoniella heveanensis BCC8398]|uniref:Cytoplasmic protein n=1 Tax=Kwoniella heveanensis BCC8398 TaxID=1296120 RepID=A0A1B9GRT9_9TREE|nr:cytoplasmic protein [Kwoniella heveanensis BCC8398]
MLPSFEPTSLSSKTIEISGRHFVDSHGRVLQLRGANVGGSSKVPSKPVPKIHDHRKASYVNRPFSLDEADEHWRRLRSWGLTFIRITVTWDAVEHAGPGIYDEEYLAYLRALLQSMEKHGLVAYVAIHQDIWSRYSGGSGAPGWTLEAAGFDLSNDGENLALSGAAFLDGIKGGRLGGERGLWPTGYQKLAAASMNTLFWGGETFAPSLRVPNDTTTIRGQKKPENIQTFLQTAFLNMFGRLVDAVGDLDGVLGFELMNEPHAGFIGLPSIHEWNYNTDLHLGQFPSPLQSFSMGAGHPTPSVPMYTRSFPFPTRVTSYTTANETGASAWGGKACPWEKEGVWRWSDAKKQAVALQEDYFAKDRKGKKVDFYEDFYYPFVRKWEDVVESRAKGKALMRMVEAIPNEYCPEWDEEDRPKNMVYAPHWYDLNALFKKQFGFMTVNVQGLSRGMFVLKALYFGRDGAKANYAKQIKQLVLEARLKLGAVPVVIGECGVPMDINQEHALKSGDWKWQEKMMDAVISAMEAAQVGFNLWTYNPANRDDIGDDWNAENFSWYSADNRSKALKKAENTTDLDAGSRLLNVIVRPYAAATAGTPLSTTFDHETAEFSYRFSTPVRVTTAEPEISEVTEIFIPRRVYQEGSFDWTVSIGGKVQFDYENERMWVWFEDSALPNDFGPRGNGSVKNRRVDIWVPGKKRESWTQGKVVAFVLFFVLAFIGVWYAQHIEWEKERRAFMYRPDLRKY